MFLTPEVVPAMSNPAVTPIVAVDLAAPDAQALGLGSGPPVPPEHRVYFYDPDQWEQFILEWAHSLHPEYIQVKRIGGSGDQGIDIAGFLSDDHLEGEWDCYQAKHYVDALTPATAYAEMLKMFGHVCLDHYTLPRKYFFVAPRGAGPTLNRLISHPTELKEKFLQAISDGTPQVAGVAIDTLAAVRKLAERTDFSMFTATQLTELLTGHAKTRYHAFRFGTALPQRGPVDAPPAELETSEARYVEELMRVYREATGSADMSVADLPDHADHSSHFQRQRRAFYSAEALRMYARDSVPPGTFDRLVDHMHEGVIEVAEADYQTGRERLTAVLTQATNVQLDSQRLVEITGPEDRRGVCHHLANDDRLKWVR
ncbi:ABC-three component system protein [Agromyces sp. NPDC127015]|uniref:ABC-three component system protein n=1 Tax=Agromyces sp. NPDC127015 TaxID=3347108 RepID=UPI003658634A